MASVTIQRVVKKIWEKIFKLIRKIPYIILLFSVACDDYALCVLKCMCVAGLLSVVCWYQNV